jgi:hypothetical protein
MEDFQDIEEKLAEAGNTGHSVRKTELDGDWHRDELEEKKEDVLENTAYLEAAFDLYQDGFLPESEVQQYAEDAKKSYEELFSTVEKVHDFNSNNSGNVELEHTEYLRNFYISTTAAVEHELEIPVADEDELSER